MKTSTVAGAACAAVLATATPFDLARRAAPTLYLTGDSTMAKDSGSVIDGWGQYMQPLVNITTVNKAIAGRSARSYTVEGHFDEVLKLVKSGDIVVIEFGHNDGGSPTSSSDNGRSDCPGTGDETCKSGKDNSTVYTFNYYVVNAAKAFIEKGAQVIISRQTPNNVWEGDKYSDAPSRFVTYAASAAKTCGTSCSFVDHFQAVADAYKKLGDAATNALYPKDHTHTSPTGAKLVAEAFVDAVNRNWNGTTPLKAYLTQPVATTW